MRDVLDPVPLPEGLDVPAEDWQQTPLRVRLVVLTLLKRLDALAARLNQNSSNSSERLYQRQCLSCGTLCKATIPADQVSGYGPRLTSCVGELAGILGASRSAVHDLCTSVFGIPLSTGAIQKLIGRVSDAIMPHDTAIGEVAHAFLVNDIDATSWLTSSDRCWRWVMVNPLVASFQRHPNRS